MRRFALLLRVCWWMAVATRIGSLPAPGSTDRRLSAATSRSSASTQAPTTGSSISGSLPTERSTVADRLFATRSAGRGSWSTLRSSVPQQPFTTNFGALTSLRAQRSAESAGSVGSAGSTSPDWLPEAGSPRSRRTASTMTTDEDGDRRLQRRLQQVSPQLTGGLQLRSRQPQSNDSISILRKLLLEKSQAMTSMNWSVSGEARAGVCPYSETTIRNTEECDDWQAFTFRYLFPGILLLALFGNALTLAVYRSRYLKSAATVLLLAAKTQANMAFVCCLTMEMLHYFAAEDSPFQDIYWNSRIYTLFLANYFGSLTVWCTLMITLETYICVAFPLSFRRWSTQRMILMVIVCLMVLAGALQVALPISREVEHHPLCPAVYRYVTVVRNGTFFSYYDHFYHYLHALTVIVLPVLLLAAFSILISYHFNRKPMGQNFSGRRRCVLRITFATTVCTLALETPSVVVFVAAAVHGSDLEQNHNYCILHVVTNTLSILDAAAPFILYVCLNHTFRRLLVAQMCSRCFPAYCRALNGCNNGATDIDQSQYITGNKSVSQFPSSGNLSARFLSRSPKRLSSHRGSALTAEELNCLTRQQQLSRPPSLRLFRGSFDDSKL